MGTQLNPMAMRCCCCNMVQEELLHHGMKEKGIQLVHLAKTANKSTAVPPKIMETSPTIKIPMQQRQMFLVATNCVGGHDGGGVVNYLQPIHTYNICCTNPCFFWREEDVAHGMYRAWRIAYCFGGRRPRIFGGEYYSVQTCLAV